MNIAALFDTDILIDVSRNVEQAISFIEDFEAREIIGISTVTQMELLVGCQNKKEFSKLERFLGRFQIIAFDAAISNTAVDLLQEYRLSHNLLIPDALIAATAITHNLPLASKNQRDFRFIKSLNC